MNKPVFCIVGKSGSGKSTYLDALLNDKRISVVGIRELKYHTTRSKRTPDEDGYYFVSYDDYINDMNSDATIIIESRKYKKFDEEVVYYTTLDDIENTAGSALICAASVDQALAYFDTLENIYIININVETKQRLQRLINRCNTDNDCYEVCRRTLEEEEEYGRLNSRSFGSHYFEINNSNISNIGDGSNTIIKNVNAIVEYIYNQSY